MPHIRHKIQSKSTAFDTRNFRLTCLNIKKGQCGANEVKVAFTVFHVVDRGFGPFGDACNFKQLSTVFCLLVYWVTKIGLQFFPALAPHGKNRIYQVASDLPNGTVPQSRHDCLLPCVQTCAAYIPVCGRSPVVPHQYLRRVQPCCREGNCRALVAQGMKAERLHTCTVTQPLHHLAL